MASRSRSRPTGKKERQSSLVELGIFGIPNLDAIDNSDDESEVDESILESELEALLSGNAPSKPVRPKAKVAPALDIESLAAECMKDPDEEDDDNDGNLSGDEDLLNELHSLTTERRKASSPSQGQVARSSVMDVLEDRLHMYNEAVKISNNYTSKVRRYQRAIKTLESLLKSAKSGGAVNEEDIPPVVNIQKPSTAVSSGPVSKCDVELPPNSMQTCEDQDMSHVNSPDNQIFQPASVNDSIPHSSLNINAESTTSQLLIRRDQYKMAALQAKRDGNRDIAIAHLKMVKTFDSVIEALKNNQPVDLSNIPPPPKGFPDLTTLTAKPSQRVTHDQIQTSSSLEKAALAAANEPQQPEIFDAPPAPSTILEALQQRLSKYSTTKKSAEAEVPPNNGKIRRLQRIIKQYETAIKDYNAGKNVDFEELPCPPGFAPIPSVDKPAMKTSPAAKHESRPTTQEGSVQISPKASDQKTSDQGGKSNVQTARKPKVQRTNTSTVGDKQLEFLLERQKLFRQAALAAKQNGDIQQAKEYLRMSKGFDSMIEATRCGLPIDACSIPTPPQLDSDFVIVDIAECVQNDDQTQEELFETLENDLRHQIEVCTKNKDHFLRLGDVQSASKFEKLALSSRKDLTVIQHLKSQQDPAPRFHYETRLFSMVQCHTDLADNDLEVTAVRGINLPGKPDELDSFVKIEFPIPSEAPQRAKTHTVKDTNNPVYQEEFKFEFNRKSRSQLRLFKRQAIKLEVWSKGGFLRSDSLLGVVNVKLVDLESKCSIHDSFNLMDGRKKACGGKLEVKLRIRDPLLVKQVEEVKEKWLVIGS